MAWRYVRYFGLAARVGAGRLNRHFCASVQMAPSAGKTWVKLSFYTPESRMLTMAHGERAHEPSNACPQNRPKAKRLEAAAPLQSTTRCPGREPSESSLIIWSLGIGG